MTGESPRRQHLRIVKVGGSLFDLPDLGARLRRWIAVQPLAVNVLLAGGGELAEIIRDADARHRLGETASHYMCIQVLGITAIWLTTIGRTWPLYKSAEAVARLANHPESQTVVFDPRRFLVSVEPGLSGERLPESWLATSDSIAARLAVAVQADELVLLKSRSAPPEQRFEQLAEVGYVDAFFPQAAEDLSAVRFVDLRR